MSRTSTSCMCLFLLALVPPRTSMAQNSTGFEAAISRIAVKYLDLFIETKDPEAKENAHKIVDALEEIRDKYSGVTVTSDSYWKEVEPKIAELIADADSNDASKTLTKKLFDEQIALLKRQGNANDGVVILIAAMKKVDGELYDWRSKVTGTVGKAAATSTTTAESGVPAWYKSFHQRWAEYHAKKLAWRRAVHGY